MIRLGHGTIAQLMVERHEDEEFLRRLGIAPDYDPESETPNAAENPNNGVENEK
jgi:hypothetical protein